MRKWTAILFLFIANSVLLVHSAVPHHFYEGSICEINTTCKTECADHKTHQHHEHQDESNNLDCELDTVVVLPSSVLNKNIAAVELEIFSNHQISFLEHNDKIGSFLIYQKHFIPQKLNLYLLSLSSNQGFRAPPPFI